MKTETTKMWRTRIVWTEKAKFRDIGGTMDHDSLADARQHAHILKKLGYNDPPKKDVEILCIETTIMTEVFSNPGPIPGDKATVIIDSKQQHDLYDQSVVEKEDHADCNQ